MSVFDSRVTARVFEAAMKGKVPFLVRKKKSGEYALKWDEIAVHHDRIEFRYAGEVVHQLNGRYRVDSGSSLHIECNGCIPVRIY